MGKNAYLLYGVKEIKVKLLSWMYVGLWYFGLCTFRRPAKFKIITFELGIQGNKIRSDYRFSPT